MISSIRSILFFFTLGVILLSFSTKDNSILNTESLTPTFANSTIKSGPIIAIIDTGIDPDHPLLKENLLSLNGVTTNKNFGLNLTAPTNSELRYRPFDELGHGTHLAGIIINLAPKSRLLALKYYLQTDSSINHLNLTVSAIEYAIQIHAKIILYASGGDGYSFAEENALKKAQNAGILVVVAAGNQQSNLDQPGKYYYPASYLLSNVLVVGAMGKNGNLLPQSNFGKKVVHLMAPGEKINSSFPGGIFGVLSGSSQAAAAVAGSAAALLSKYPYLTFYQLKEFLINGSKHLSALSEKCSSEGMLNLAGAEQIAERALTPVTAKAKILKSEDTKSPF